MSSDLYRILCSEAKKAEFREVVATAREHGQFEMAVQAGEWLLEELARTPLEIGESRDELVHLKLKIRFHYVRPIAVQYAVHEVERKVFIVSFRFRS